MEHPSDAQLVEWTRGNLQPRVLVELEAHVDACNPCAERLTAAAREHVMFQEVADAAPVRRSWVPVWAVGALMAASTLFWATRLPPTGASTSDLGVDVTVDCTVQSAPEICLDAARRRGLMMGGEVPRYETAGLCIDCGKEER
jgi:hypothetical protein